MMRSLRYFLSIFHRARRALRSMPEVGSSRRTSLDPPTSAIDTDSLRLLPPESDPDYLSLSTVRPTSLTMSSISFVFLAGSPPLSSKKRSRCSIGVKSSNKTSCWGHTPINWRTSCMSLNTSRSKTEAFPSVGTIRPVSIEIVVVLPAPFWPSSAKICP